jgi:hypothetical protein
MKSADGRECSSFLRHKKIALSGKKTGKLYLLNPQERKVEKVEVDGCAITDGLRCDWLVLINDRKPHKEIYVELKGSKISHAVEQLEATINNLSANRTRLAKRCLVVFSRNPMTGTDVQKNKVKFLKNFNAVFQLVRDGTEVPLY